jgi:methylmalonyl-CoA/ethylmalonyl-CoA epimerase
VILGIDHVGVATDDPARAAPFLTALGFDPGEQGVADAYRVACEFWRLPNDGGRTTVELVSPLSEDSAVGGHLDRRGPGLYHLALRVDDVEQELARLRRAGFVAVDAEPCAGALAGMRVAFVYAARPAGLLVELVQHDAGTG